MRRKEREIKDTSELVKILSKTCVGTLSVSGGEYPYAVPLNFGFSENDGEFKVYFHCASEGKKIELIKRILKCVLKCILWKESQVREKAPVFILVPMKAL